MMSLTVKGYADHQVRGCCYVDHDYNLVREDRLQHQVVGYVHVFRSFSFLLSPMAEGRS